MITLRNRPSSYFGFPIRRHHGGFSIHFSQTLRLPSLLPPACPPSPQPFWSSLLSFSWKLHISAHIVITLTFHMTAPCQPLLPVLLTEPSYFLLMCSFLVTPREPIAIVLLLVLAASTVSLSSLLYPVHISSPAPKPFQI